MARTKRQEEIKERPKIWNTALYIRLSREDGDKLESDSVVTQRDMLSTYVQENPELVLHDTYVDDGFTGTNFDRPDFKRMMRDISQRRINCIIVKDLSRLGRNSARITDFVDDVIITKGIRFIALNDRIDSYTRPEDVDDMVASFKNVFNEQYARDISRKVRSALDTKRKKGEFIGSFACYGYKKDPNDKNHLIIDETVANNVRTIYKWFVEGMPKLSIALKLNDMGIPCPSEYKKQQGLKYVNPNRLISTTYWTHTSIHRILKSEIYAGDLVQHTETVRSFKIKKNVQLPKSDWIIVKNTHEAIIDRATWDTAQRLLQTDIKKSQYTGEIHMFAGLIKCADCGRSMKMTKRNDKKYFICGTYKSYGKDKCESHSIKYNVLEKMVFDELKEQIKKYADFNQVHNSFTIKQKIRNQMQSSEKAIAELESMMEKKKQLRMGLYEDFKTGIINKEEYIEYKAKYEDSIENLEKQIEELKAHSTSDSATDELAKSAELVLKYQNIQTLTREMLVSLVRCIKVHKDQTIDIYFTFKAI